MRHTLCQQVSHTLTVKRVIVRFQNLGFYFRFWKGVFLRITEVFLYLFPTSLTLLLYRLQPVPMPLLASLSPSSSSQSSSSSLDLKSLSQSPHLASSSCLLWPSHTNCSLSQPHLPILTPRLRIPVFPPNSLSS